jgi:hypothetical protein
MAATLSFLAIIGLLFVGALLALPARVPPIRKLARRFAAARVALIVILGLLSYLIVFMPLARLGADAIYTFGTWRGHGGLGFGAITFFTEPQNIKSAIIDELWVRQMIPPPLRQPCYSPQAKVCQRADAIAAAAGPSNWDNGAYFQLAGTGLVSVAANVYLVWLFTRR